MEPLLLSGLQHYKFCPRQWALIHIEQLWAENYRTADGQVMHRNAHDKSFSESRGDMRVIRGLQVASQRLNVTGECDVVEFHQSDSGVSMPRWEGLWQPYPVEYKRGSPGSEGGDDLQLCAQAMCLEEMLCCTIPEGSLYYGETRRRQCVRFTEELRQEVRDALTEMHRLRERGCTPRVRPRRGCGACSLKELCLPKLMKCPPASEYIRAHMEDTP